MQKQLYRQRKNYYRFMWVLRNLAVSTCYKSNMVQTSYEKNNSMTSFYKNGHLLIIIHLVVQIFDYIKNIPSRVNISQHCQIIIPKFSLLFELEIIDSRLKREDGQALHSKTESVLCVKRTQVMSITTLCLVIILKVSEEN